MYGRSVGDYMPIYYVTAIYRINLVKPISRPIRYEGSYVAIILRALILGQYILVHTVPRTVRPTRVKESDFEKLGKKLNLQINSFVWFGYR